MQKKVKTPRELAQFEAMHKLFDYFNEILFDGKLKPCLFNFSRHSKAFGFFAPNRWTDTRKNVKQKHCHEISINPDFLARGHRDVLGTFVHELCHLWQHEHGKPTPGYHNKEFAEIMERVGLITSHDGTSSGRRVGQKMTHYILDGGAYDKAFKKLPKSLLYPLIAKQEPAKIRVAKAKKNKVKYTCNCGNNVWGKPELKIICPDCNSNYAGA